MRTHKLLIVSSLALAVGAFGPAYAATTDNSSTQQKAAAQSGEQNLPSDEQRMRKREEPQRVEARIQELHDKLHITTDPESKWKDVGDAMRKTAKEYRDVIDKQAEKAKGGPVNAVDHLRDSEQVAQAHVDGIKRITDPFEDLYKSMTPDQQKNADAVFEDPSTQRSASAAGSSKSSSASKSSKSMSSGGTTR
jgi:protein CpxP